MWWIVFSVIVVALLIISARSARFERSRDGDDLKERLIQVSRELCRSRGNPYVDNYSDKEFLDLYDIINHKFDIIARQRGESVTGSQKLNILNKVIYASMGGKDSAMKHLEYELDKYKKYGIRKV